MDIDKIIQKHLASGSRALNEWDSKQFLKKYGLPVVEEKRVSNAMEADRSAQQIGYPVVVKGLGSTLMHKTDRGLVHLNLSSSRAVHNAIESISATAGDDIEGFLVQPQIRAKREFVAGLIRDPQFGPVIMFGLGGIFTEVLADVAFRLAPLNKSDAEEMLKDIQAQALLGNFRGDKPVKLRQLTDILMALSQIAVDHPEIGEIDINPLMIQHNGDVCAVDGLVVLSDKKKIIKPLPPVNSKSIGSLFHPESIAFIGASGQLGKWGHRLLVNTISGGYEGEIYPVNPRSGTIAGRKVYKSVSEIPGKIGLAVVTIPAAGVLDLLPRLEEKEVRYVLLISSGFSESGSQGQELEKRLVAAAYKAGILLLGPNTMGICNPHLNFYCTGSPVQPAAGSTAVVSQSGNMGVQLLSFADQQGIGIRGFCGSGNEAMLTIEDFLEGFEGDPLTRTVMLYIESVKNGRRFFEAARRLTKKKPVILLKGGRTGAGSRAAASHTGALSSDNHVFDAVCKQAGIVQVAQPMDLLDLSAAFSSLPLPAGNRVAIMTLGGGWGVVTADLCAEFSLEVPVLDAGLIQQIDQILPPYWSRANPIDLVGENDISIPMTVMETLMNWEGCDGVINLGILGRGILLRRYSDSVLSADPAYTPDFLDGVRAQVFKWEQQYVAHIVGLMEKFNKPVFGVSLSSSSEAAERTIYPVKGLPHKGVFYPSPERAVKSFAKMVEYRRFLSR